MITLSAAGFNSGVDFACTSSYCEARSPVAWAAFRGLQAAANALSTRLGLGTQLSVDGKIGQKTVDLIQLLAAKVNIDTQSALKTYWQTSKEEIARNAAVLAGELAALLQAGSGQLPPGTPPVVASGSKPNTVLVAQLFPNAGSIAPQAGMTVTNPNAPTTSAVPPLLVPRVETKYVVAGLFALGLAVLGGVAVATRRKRSAA